MGLDGNGELSYAYAPYPYIEWYGRNGRVVLELDPSQVEIVDGTTVRKVPRSAREYQTEADAIQQLHALVDGPIRFSVDHSEGSLTFRFNEIPSGRRAPAGGRPVRSATRGMPMAFASATDSVNIATPELSSVSPAPARFLLSRTWPDSSESPSWVYERTRRRGRDRLPHVKVGKYLRFRLSDLEAYLETLRRG